MTKPCTAWLRYFGRKFLKLPEEEKPLIASKFHTSLSQTNLIVQIVHGWLNLLQVGPVNKTRLPSAFLSSRLVRSYVYCMYKICT